MILRRLATRSFRNLREGAIAFDDGINLFVGDNGQGKTNFLEAIYFLATTKSFRTTTPATLIAIGQETAFVEGEVEHAGITRRMSIGIRRDAHRRRELLINGQPAPLRSFLGVLDVIAYSAERLDIIRGGPDERRRFLDRGIASIDAAYLTHLSDFTRTLKQRNALLQGIRAGEKKPASLDAWDEELQKTGSEIARARRDYSGTIASEFARILDEHHYHVRDLTLTYRPHEIDFGTTERDEALRRLRDLRRREIQTGYSLAGPHRDDLEFRSAALPAAEILSSGEQKMLVFFLKFAKLSIYRDLHGHYPCLILDDLDAELDLKILRRVLLYLGGRTQVFTSSAKELFFRELDLGKTRLIHVREGSAEQAPDGRS